jgi:glyoxylase-like metal-dependent hydrolase (beta-lactamase superfamily II)
MQVAPGVHRLTQGVVNWYLIDDGGKLILVDAGVPGDWLLLTHTVAELGRSLFDIEAVILTHAHTDHTGFAERARSTANATVHVHRDDVSVARGTKPGKNDGTMARYVIRPEFYRTTFSLLRRGGGRIVPVAEASAFEDGDHLDVPGGPTIIHAPGHTPGCAALELPRRRVLFTGDTLITRNPLTGRVGPQIMPSGFNANTPQALESLSLLGRSEADLVLPGHGEPWADGLDEAIRAAIAAGPT